MNLVAGSIRGCLRSSKTGGLICGAPKSTLHSKRSAIGDLLGEDGREIVEMRDEMRAVRAAFGALTEDQRVVLALIVLEDLSYAQAAETLGVPIGTIMSRLSRARAALSTAVQRSVVVPMRRGK